MSARGIGQPLTPPLRLTKVFLGLARGHNGNALLTGGDPLFVELSHRGRSARPQQVVLRDGTLVHSHDTRGRGEAGGGVAGGGGVLFQSVRVPRLAGLDSVSVPLRLLLLLFAENLGVCQTERSLARARRKRGSRGQGRSSCRLTIMLFMNGARASGSSSSSLPSVAAV